MIPASSTPPTSHFFLRSRTCCAESAVSAALQRLAAQHVISQSSVVPPRAFEALPLTAATIGAPAHRPLLISAAVIGGLALTALSRRDWIGSSGIEDDDWRRVWLGLAFVGYRIRRGLVPGVRSTFECQAWLRRLLSGLGGGWRRRRRLPDIGHRRNCLTRAFRDIAPASSKPPDQNSSHSAAYGEYRYCEGRRSPASGGRYPCPRFDA
jgi:hypothetical protein